MKLEGSCHCGRVKFSAESTTPQPYQRCYCSICRKTNGGGGFAINIMVQAKTLKASGEENINTYQAQNGGKTSPMQRKFCMHCGSGLWGYDPRWPDIAHPFASAIDTPLPVPVSTTHIMTDFKAAWVEPEIKSGDAAFERYPDISIDDWHQKHSVKLDESE